MLPIRNPPFRSSTVRSASCALPSSISRWRKSPGNSPRAAGGVTSVPSRSTKMLVKLPSVSLPGIGEDRPQAPPSRRASSRKPPGGSLVSQAEIRTARPAAAARRHPPARLGLGHRLPALSPCYLSEIAAGAPMPAPCGGKWRPEAHCGGVPIELEFRSSAEPRRRSRWRSRSMTQPADRIAWSP